MEQMEEGKAVDDLLEALRKNWKFPAVVHFCRVFEGVLGLKPFSSDLLEKALLSPGEHPVFFSELVSRLLYPGRKLSQNPEAWPTWEPNLQKKVKANWNLVLNKDPLSGRHFVDLSSSEKLDVLYLLTEVALQNSALLRDTIRNTVEDPYLTADSVRCLPIGENAEGEKFFLFSLRYEDCRLYKQSPCKQEADKQDSFTELSDEVTFHTDIEAPDWTTVTTSLRELQDFVVDVRRSKNQAEKKLYKYLSGILPEFERTERHRKREEERAAAREQTPLLKRSSRLQEQAKRKEEQERSTPADDKDLSNGMEGKEEGTGEDDPNVDMGISREERMRLRNQRREMAEKGLRRVLTGKKRMLEYDGLTPLGPSVKCLSQKRVQNVRPPRQVNKLVSIIWEKFRKPMHHRKQFELHLEAVKKRKIAYLHNRPDFSSRPKPPIYVSRQQFEKNAFSGLKLGNDCVAGDSHRSYPPQRNALFNFMHTQRPSLQSYPMPPALRMPPPLQNTVDNNDQSLRPILQQHMRSLQPHTRESLMKFPSSLQQSFLSDSLKKQLILKRQNQQMQHHQEHNKPSLNLFPQVCGNNGQHGSGDNVRNPSVAYPYSHLPPQSSVGFVRPFAGARAGEFLCPGQNPRILAPRVGADAAMTPSFRNVRPTLLSNQLSPSLVQLPSSLESVVKNSWNSKYPTIVGGQAEAPRVAVAQPLYSLCPDRDLRTTHPMMFENGGRWQPMPQIRGTTYISSESNNPNSTTNRIRSLYLDPEGDNRQSNDNH